MHMETSMSVNRVNCVTRSKCYSFFIFTVCVIPEVYIAPQLVAKEPIAKIVSCHACTEVIVK